MKPQLVARLTKILKAGDTEGSEEQDTAATEACGEENNFDVDIDMTDIVVIDEYDSTKMPPARVVSY